MATTPAEKIDMLVEFARTMNAVLDELAKNECADEDVQTAVAMMLQTSGYDEQEILDVIFSIRDDVMVSFRTNFYQGKQIAALSALTAAASASIERTKQLAEHAKELGQ